MPLAAKKGDRVSGTCTHVVQVPTVGGPIPTPTPGHTFAGVIDDKLSGDVLIENQPAAYEGSMAHNQPPHVPIGGPAFQPPAPRDGKPAARSGDAAATCCISRTPANVVVSTCSVEIGS
jgi:uncharacterized Zn-binding protein involved in type VI secretion